MLKKLIKPFQKVLLKKRLCVGCTHPLDKVEKKEEFEEGKELVQCKCKRRYIYDKSLNTYRRMTLEEEQEYLKNQE